MAGGRSNAKTLLSAGDGGVVNALDIDAMGAKKLIGGGLADLGIADQNRNNVGWVRNDRDIKGSESSLQGASVSLLSNALMG
jgi:hypothetical protein